MAETEVVQLGDGTTIELRGCESQGDGFIRYRYASPAPISGLHLIEYGLYEGGGWIVLNGRSGRSYYLRGEPIFSPTRRWLATANEDLAAGYTSNHVDLWLVEYLPTGIELLREISLDGSDEWGATDLRWISPDTVEFARVTWAAQSSNGRLFDTTLVRLASGPDGWDFTAAPDRSVATLSNKGLELTR